MSIRGLCCKLVHVDPAAVRRRGFLTLGLGLVRILRTIGPGFDRLAVTLHGRRRRLFVSSGGGKNGALLDGLRTIRCRAGRLSSTGRRAVRQILVAVSRAFKFCARALLAANMTTAAVRAILFIRVLLLMHSMRVTCDLRALRTRRPALLWRRDRKWTGSADELRS